MSVATQQVTTRLPEFQEQYIADLLTSAQNLFKPTDEGGKGLSMPFVQQQLAGLSTGQQKAISQALSGVGAYQPFLSGVDPETGEMLAPQTGALQALETGLGTAQTLAAGAGMSPTAYKEYMDPYLDSVVARAQKDIGEQGLKQEQRAAAQAVGSGAFGGSRQAVLQGEIAANTLEQQARTGERLRSAGFSQASKLAQDAAAQQLRQAQLTGGLAQGLAGGISQLGMQGQQMAGQDINTLLGIGGLQQQQAQQGLNVAQQNALAQQQLPFQQLGFLGDIFRGVPALQQQTTQTYTPPPSLLSQGIGLLGAGLYGGFFNSPTAAAGAA
tara:strand:+ start:685 stop:1665 length:981 start_codon:yes stop_codon:yes gene_type:complete